MAHLKVAAAVLLALSSPLEGVMLAEEEEVLLITQLKVVINKIITLGALLPLNP